MRRGKGGWEAGASEGPGPLPQVSSVKPRPCPCRGTPPPPPPLPPPPPPLHRPDGGGGALGVLGAAVPHPLCPAHSPRQAGPRGSFSTTQPPPPRLGRLVLLTQVPQGELLGGPRGFAEQLSISCGGGGSDTPHPPAPGPPLFK